ncbi:MAG: GGDEF domain-containing protein [Armatimonadota bacterium]|nr:GGDEF domain-containing protein [bacterium]MDW8320619.1 GGDEF domain-containing protein [Armatimonadota bacterium]
MIASDTIPHAGIADARSSGAPRLASLPRATAKALEQLIDTMLAALHVESGVLWIEHEHTPYTLVTRNMTVVEIQAIQLAVAVCNQQHPVTLQVGGQSYAVSCSGHPLLMIYAAVKVGEMRPLYRKLMPRFTRLAQTLLQANASPIGMPADDPSHQAYRVVVESSLRRLCELMQATGCTMLWFSTWNNSWHRFAVGSVPIWLYQQLWEMPTPGNGLEVWTRGIEALIHQHGHHCVTDAMVVRNMVKGCVFLWRDKTRGGFNSEEVEWLRVTVQMIAASLDVLETQTELLRRVYQDPLTGVFNRLYFETVYRQILHNAQRHPRPVSLLLMDIDNFKQINDTFGHETGDMVLQLVGQVLQQVRSGDIPARYGGDEFVVLLPDTDKAGARTLAQRLQTTLKQASEQLGLPFALTLSIGCATVTNGDTSLLLLADQDMYEQKRNEKTPAR